MVIVAGHITGEPEQREPYLAGCMSAVEKLAGQTAVSTLPSRPTCSTLAEYDIADARPLFGKGRA